MDVKKEEAECVAEEINVSGEAKAYVTDLRSVKNIEKIVKEIFNDFGRIDVLVNIAGLANRTPNEDITEEEWDLLNDVNLKAPFFMSKEVYKVMLNQNNGKLINLASQRAHTTDGTHTIYDATKAGIQALSRGFAVSGGRKGIVANTVTPGYVLTPMTAHNLERKDWVEHMQERIPMGRFIEMQEVANLILFLASDDCSGVNGQNFVIDGGWTIHD